ncbi:catalase [Pseudoduganella sp. FT26W]|uniref:Catalase-related peroxidase n=1 Tax=Duganella aquatilis TaxID=2666082 RepID=A0A844D6F5_9BURK|nr:catalase [Duganella aquatilis]
MRSRWDAAPTNQEYNMEHIIHPASAPSPADLVDALNHTFGKHPGQRASHAKGFCASGQFTPTMEAAGFANGPIFRDGHLQATLRFSVGGGNPGVSDKSRSVRGLAVRIGQGAEHWDLVLLSEPVFFAATPESFVSFLAARVADPETKKPNPDNIAAHNLKFPDGARQPALLAAHAAPASYADTRYYSNNAFVFHSVTGESTTARIIAIPAAGTRYLTAEQEQSFPDNFLEDELATRLAQGPVDFEIVAQLPAAGDSLVDSSLPWQGAGHVSLGRLRVTSLAGAGACDDMVFVPVNLPAGLSPSDDRGAGSDRHRHEPGQWRFRRRLAWPDGDPTPRPRR